MSTAFSWMSKWPLIWQLFLSWSLICTITFSTAIYKRYKLTAIGFSSCCNCKNIAIINSSKEWFDIPCCNFLDRISTKIIGSIFFPNIWCCCSVYFEIYQNGCQFKESNVASASLLIKFHKILCVTAFMLLLFWSSLTG